MPVSETRGFQVVHPLDDVAERSAARLYAYLVVIGLAVGYRVLTLAGVFGHPLH